MRAVCTWGDGPDVLVDLDNTTVALYEAPWSDPPPRGRWAHGCISKGSFDLTSEEAEKLGYELIAAAEQSKELDRMCAEHDEAEETAENNSRLNPSFGTSVKDAVEKGKACPKCAKNDTCKDVCKLEGWCLRFEPEKKLEWNNIKCESCGEAHHTVECDKKA